MNSEIPEVNEEWAARLTSPHAAATPVRPPLSSRSSPLPARCLARSALPPLVMVWLGRHLAGWQFMWLMTLGLFCSAKLLTLGALLGRVERNTQEERSSRLLFYIFLWVGMDARSFCAGDRPSRPEIREWLEAVLKVVLGLVLLMTILPSVPAEDALRIGWMGMLGVTLVVHFGLLHLLSLGWRRCGIAAEPIMRSPGTATSLGAFWGNRWNRAFSDLARVLIFKRVARRWSAVSSTLVVFLISGLLHELVISVPAGGGYGWPTSYFGLQGLGVLFERTRLAKRLGIGSGWRGWCFVALVAGVPAMGLFHPKFIRVVILPMLHALGVR